MDEVESIDINDPLYSIKLKPKVDPDKVINNEGDTEGDDEGVGGTSEAKSKNNYNISLFKSPQPQSDKSELNRLDLKPISDNNSNLERWFPS